jgi:hypothetical protein
MTVTKLVQFPDKRSDPGSIRPDIRHLALSLCLDETFSQPKWPRGEVGGLSLAAALSLCVVPAASDPERYERAALRWLQRFIEERLPPLTEVALAAAALAELMHGPRNVGVDALKRVVRR